MKGKEITSNGWLIELLNEKERDMRSIVEGSLDLGLKDFVKKSLQAVVNKEGVEVIKSNLANWNNTIAQSKGVVGFVDSIDDKILPDKELIAQEAKAFEEVRKLLQSTQEDFAARNYLEAFGLSELFKKQISNLDKICTSKDYAYKEGTLSYSGYFIRTSELAREIEEGKYIADNKIAVVRIYAYGAVIMDCDLLSKKLASANFVIIAPKWNITESRVSIDLSGLHGNGHPYNAPDATEHSKSGVNGLKGEDGFNGGDFLGLGNSFHNLERLKVTSNGGKGGNGQSGGNGSEGIKGQDASIDDVSKATGLHRSYTKSIGGETEEYYRLEGSSGSPGGRGGKGGAGGQGGDQGYIELLYNQKLEEKIALKAEAINGENGIKGEDGQDGVGGLYGDTAVRVYYQNGKKPIGHSKYSLENICNGWKEAYTIPSFKRCEATSEPVVSNSSEVKGQKEKSINGKGELKEYQTAFTKFNETLDNLKLDFPFEGAFEQFATTNLVGEHSNEFHDYH